MDHKANSSGKLLGLTEIAVGVSVTIVLFVCMLVGKAGFSLQTLAACTGAVMCTQESGKASWKACLTRLLGVITGGVVGIALVALDNVMQLPAVFYLLCGVGIVANILFCKLLKIPFIQAKVSCMTLLLVVLVLGGPARYSYALGRFIGTLCGALVAMGVSMLFALFQKEKHQK